MVRDRSFDDIADALVAQGLTTPAQVTRARAARSGRVDSTAINLVVQGAVDAEALAEVLSREVQIPRARRDEIEGITADVFSVVPVEVIYDSGVMPLGYDDGSHLVVGVVDPTERTGLDEAQFYAGREFELRVMSATEFAAAFEVASGQPWRVSATELVEAQRALTAAQRQLDADLHDLFAQPRRPLMEARSEAGAVVVELGADPDGEVVELGASVSAPGRAPRPSLEVVPVTGAPTDAPIIELGESGGLNVAPEELPEPIDLPPPPTAAPERSSTTTVRRAAPQSPGEEPVPSGRSSGSAPRRPGKQVDSVEIEPVGTVARTGTPIGGVPATSTQPIPRAAELPLAGRRRRRRGPPAGVRPGATPSAGVQRVMEVGEFDMAGDWTDVGDWTEVGASGRPLRSTALRVPTVGEYAGANHDGKFAPLAELVDGMGDVAPATRAAFRLLEAGLGAAHDRDDVARQLVETLNLIYPTVAVLSLRLPGVVVWDAALSTGGAAPIGERFDVADGSLWHRLAAEPVAFLGRLPVTDPLRRRLPKVFEGTSLAIPLRLGKRPVGVVVLDTGGPADLPSPGPDAASLSGWVEAALKRIIVRRRSSDRSV